MEQVHQIVKIITDDTRPQDCKIDYPSISCDNEFIPISALANGELLQVEQMVGDAKMIAPRKIKKMLLSYDLRVRTSAIYGSRQFREFSANLFGEMHSNSNLYWNRIVGASITRDYISSNGIIIYMDRTIVGEETMTPLLVLAAKKEYMGKINKISPDLNQFCILVDRSFINDEEHFKIYRNIKKNYLDIVESKIDILYTNNLMGLCYKPSIIYPKFRTIPEMIEYNKSMNEVLVSAMIGELRPDPPPRPQDTANYQGFGSFSGTAVATPTSIHRYVISSAVAESQLPEPQDVPPPVTEAEVPLPF